MRITDTDRIEALAEALNTLVVYEGPGRVQLKSNRPQSGFVAKRRIKHWRCGVNVALLRSIADGLVRSQKDWIEKNAKVTRD